MTKGSSQEEFIAVHLCKTCGAVTERSAVNADSIFSGLIKCASCGQEHDLNIQIIENSAKRPPAKVAIPPA
jgi:transcription elongation factor Elf1